MLMKRLNEQFANKIVPGLGLCIIIYDLVDVGVSYILPGDGSTHTKVKVNWALFALFEIEFLN